MTSVSYAPVKKPRRMPRANNGEKSVMDDKVTIEPPLTSIEDRVAICKRIPDEDWVCYAGFKHLGVSIEHERIVDADNNLTRLAQRLDERFSEDPTFIAPGRKKDVRRRVR